MQKCLKLLTLKEILEMLKYLVRCFDIFEESVSITLDEKYFRPNFPSFLKVTEWCNLIIDSHLVQLVLVDECYDIVQQLNNLVSRHVQLIEAMAGLRGCLAHYFEQDPLNSAEIGDYQIEIFRL